MGGVGLIVVFPLFFVLPPRGLARGEQTLEKRKNKMTSKPTSTPATPDAIACHSVAETQPTDGRLDSKLTDGRTEEQQRLQELYLQQQRRLACPGCDPGIAGVRIRRSTHA